MSNNPPVEKIRQRCWYGLSPAAANAAGLELAQLQQFVAHNFTPTQAQLLALARYFRMAEYVR